MMKTPPRCTIVLLLLFAAAACFAEDSAPPRATDDRLTFELFAEAPMIVTPSGIAVDREGRVFVAEMHTHKRPESYDGPKTDRIRVFEDTDGDGKADRASTFYEGLVHTMDLAFHPDGSLYVSERDRIIRLRDTDGDLKADEVEPIVRLKTAWDYPHNGLSSMEFGFGGDLYFGLGENHTEPYTLVGSDGKKIEGGGGIGRVFHCNADGSGLRPVARGLWNPFGLCRDSYGRMFLTDNDPHDRPPCRLIHVVPGGDYGYERRYDSGLHPLNAWDGELPGTLPMISGTAEAPGGIIAYGSDGLPAEYRGQLMTPAWSDHRIEVFPLQRRGASFTAQRQTLVQGGDSFRPVDLAVAPDGSIYVSDWGSSSYQVNGKGRIWRLAAKDQGSGPRVQGSKSGRDREGSQGSDSAGSGLERWMSELESADRYVRERAARRLARAGSDGRDFLRERMRRHEDPLVRTAALRALAMVNDKEADFAAVAREDAATAVRRLAAEVALEQGTPPAELIHEGQSPAVRAVILRHLKYPEHRDVLFEALHSEDPFLRTAAVEGMRDDAEAILANVPPLPEEEGPRLGVLLALRRSGVEAARELLPEFLHDPAPAVRFAAVKWIADHKLTDFKPAIEDLLKAEDLTLRLYLAGYAALDRLEGREPRNQPPADALRETVFNKDAPPRLRRYALRLIDPGHKSLTVERLRPLLDHPDPQLRLEAVRTLQHHPDEARFGPLAAFAGDESRSSRARAEAVVGLAPAAGQHVDLLMKLARGDEPVLRDEALRALVGVELSSAQRAALEQLAEDQPETAPAVARLLPDQDAAPRPPADNTEAWLKLVADAGEGDPAAGRRIFFHPTLTACSTCHRVRGRGTRVGPDLSLINRRGGRSTLENPAQEASRNSASASMSDPERTLHRWLLNSILQPSEDIAPQFTTWAIEMDDGETRLGLPLRKGDNGEVYLGLDGEPFGIRRKNMVSRHELPISIMPAGLAHRLTPAELRDLLAFLTREH